MTAKWITAPLGELCEINIGRTPSRAESRYWGSGHRWLSIADMNQGVDLYGTREEITDAALRECNCRLLAPGTLVMSFKLTVGKLGFVRKPMCTNEAIAALPIRDPQRLDGRFLYRALQLAPLLQDADRAVKGLTLNSDKLARVQISFPRDVDEQRRIADILDKADAIQRKRKDAITLTEELLRSAFVETFGDPVTNPKGWLVKPLDELVEPSRGISYGVVQRGPEVANGVPVVRISNFGDNRFDGSVVVRTSSEISNAYRRTILRGGELVVSIRGTVGRVAIVPKGARGWNVSREVAVVPLIDGISGDLVHRALLTDGVQRFILGNVKGVAQSGINLSDLRQAPIPCPPTREIERFEDITRMAHAIESCLADAAASTASLFETLARNVSSMASGQERAC